jgi:hypothetical protein
MSSENGHKATNGVRSALSEDVSEDGQFAIVSEAMAEIGRQSDVRFGKIVDDAMRDFERDFTKIKSPRMRATIMETQLGITPLVAAERPQRRGTFVTRLMSFLHMGGV